MPRRDDLESILIIGAGPIVIGQACEFDYSGTQACKALKEEGYRVILVNSNPATLRANMRPTHVSLFDGSLQGLARTDRAAFCFQGHPEASPGPQEMGAMFDRFVHLMLRRLQQKLRARSTGKQPPPDKAA